MYADWGRISLPSRNCSRQCADQPGADHRVRAIGSADLEHHVERRARCAAVQGTFERADGAGNRGDDIGSRRRNYAGGECGRVEPVIADRVENVSSARDRAAEGSSPNTWCR
jgi:hypothetical protein